MIVTPKGHALGLVAGLRDARDHPFMAQRRLTLNLPATFDKRSSVRAIYDQGPIGSCTGHGLVGSHRMLLAKLQKPDLAGSRLGAYFLGRQIENTIASDGGAQIRDVIKGAVKTGVMPEADWPYDPRRFADTPPDQAFTDAGLHMVTGYQAIPNSVTAMRAAIHQNWHAIIGIAIYESFESDKVAATGKVPMPKPSSEQLLGWHCVYLVGWTKAGFHAVNSWGGGWGAKGTFLLPNGFVEDVNLLDDAWTLMSA